MFKILNFLYNFGFWKLYEPSLKVNTHIHSNSKTTLILRQFHETFTISLLSLSTGEKAKSIGQNSRLGLSIVMWVSPVNHCESVIIVESGSVTVKKRRTTEEGEYWGTSDERYTISLISKDHNFSLNLYVLNVFVFFIFSNYVSSKVLKYLYSYF